MMESINFDISLLKYISGKVVLSALSDLLPFIFLINIVYHVLLQCYNWRFIGAPFCPFILIETSFCIECLLFELTFERFTNPSLLNAMLESMIHPNKIAI